MYVTLYIFLKPASKYLTMTLSSKEGDYFCRYEKTEFRECVKRILVYKFCVCTMLCSISG